MDITYYKLVNDSLKQDSRDIKPEVWNKELDLISIRSENRKEVVDYFHQLNHLNNILDCIEHPEKYPFSNTFENVIILNLSVSNSADIYQTDYISVIIEGNLIITLTPQSGDLFNEHYLSTYSQKKFPSLSNFVFYVVAGKILTQSNGNIGNARKRLQVMELKLKDDPEKLSSKEVMSCERDISELSDIIEDQYIGFGVVASLSSSSHRVEDSHKLNELIKGFNPLDKAMQRLEKRAESLRLQYMLFQQEKSTRKINVLTIIQAIFVPLTFIAGVYGMNFVNMPELDWKLGYLLVWLVFVVLAGSLLSYFYRKGWFD